MGLGAGAVVLAVAALACYWPRVSHFVRFHIELHQERHAMWVAQNERRRVAESLGFPRSLPGTWH